MSRQLLSQVVKQLKGEVSSLMAKTLTGREHDMFKARFEHCFDYNMSDGKYARSALGLDIYKALSPNATEQDTINAAKVVATNELLQTFLLVTDDVMDHASTRRGKPCWYTLPGIGLTAINDGMLLDSAIDVVVRTTIPNHPRMDHVLRDIYETKKTTVIGQTLDSLMSGFDGVAWSRYNQVVLHKTSHYTYLLPLQLGFHLADRSDYRLLEPLMFKIGYYFQAQDDFLDIFGDNKVTGKTSTDLAEGKCTWVVCTLLDLLQKSNSTQLLGEFKETFGKTDEASIQKLQKMIADHNVKELFEAFEKKEVSEIQGQINQVQPFVIKPVLQQALDSLVGRKK